MYHNYNFSLPTFLEGAEGRSIREAVINLGNNVYNMDYSLVLKNHDVTIRGNGQNNTVIRIGNNISLGNGIHSIFKIFGEFDENTDEKIAVEISDLTIMTDVSQQEANSHSSDLTQNVTHILEFRNLRSLVMRNVRIISKNIVTTCIDIRRGYNIDIRNCTFANYNRCSAGGVLWLRGDTVNVTVENCDFYKYGGDEILGIWGTNNFEGYNIISAENQLAGINEIHKKNINIRHNRIYSQDENGGENHESIITESGSTWNGCIERFITLYTNQTSNTVSGGSLNSIPCHYILNGIHFDNNEFYINSPIRFLFTIALDKYTTFKDISINNNIIKYGTWTVDGVSYINKSLTDFIIQFDTQYDNSPIPGNYDLTSDEVFRINGNTIECGSNARYSENNYYVDDHRCLDVTGVHVIFNENHIVFSRGDYSEDEATYANKGIRLITCRQKGCKVRFNNNHCEGLMSLLRAEGKNTAYISRIDVKGYGNYLHGNPRIFQMCVNECHVSLVNNDIVSDYQSFFLSEFADAGTAIFMGNRVYRDLSRVTNYTVPRGHIYYTGAAGSTNNTSMRFICCDNVFDNILYSSSMYSDLERITNIKKIHKNNIFADLIES